MLSLYKELAYHTKVISHILLLKDGRLSSSSGDKTVIIYNKKSFQPDLIIKEHTNFVNYHIQLKNENIVTCSWDFSLKIIKLKPDNKYEVVQTLNEHKNVINKAIETEEGELLTISDDKNLIIWKKNENNELFEIEKKINVCKEDYPNSNIVLINESILLCSSIMEKHIQFFDLKNNCQLLFVFTSVECWFSRNAILYIDDRDLLLVGGKSNNGIFLFKLKKIPVFIGKFYERASEVYSIILDSEGNLLVGLEEKRGKEKKYNICKFKINNNNNELIYINKMENAHKNFINGIIDWKEKNIIISCSKDTKIKFWKKMKK